MAHGSKALIEALGDLAATCRAADEGYNKAAEGVHNDQLRALFNRLSVERSRSLLANWTSNRFVWVIGQAIPGMEAACFAVDGSIWSNAFELVQNCFTGEQGSLPQYERALRLLVDNGIRVSLTRQYESIRVSLDQLRAGALTRQAAARSKVEDLSIHETLDRYV